MSHDDFAFEPIPGLPAMLPAGERLLWQGAPDWKSLAIHAYHVRKVGYYFAALVAWRAVVGFDNATAAASIALSCLWIATLGLAAMAVLCALAYFTARSTVYSISTARVVMRQGIAVPITINLPFNLIDAAQLKKYSSSGDIYMQLPKDQRIGYLVTWPHVRPGHFTHPQPSLKALLDAERAADILSQALADQAGVASITRIVSREREPAVVSPANPRTSVAA